MTKPSSDIQIRIRPPRIAVITSKMTQLEDLIKVLNFLSHVRGGKYARFIFIDISSTAAIQATKNEIKDLYPEIILLPSNNEESDLRFFQNIYFPQCIDVSRLSFDRLNEPDTGGLTPYYRIVEQELRKHPDLKRTNLFFVKTNPSKSMLPYVAAVYGILPDSLVDSLASHLNAEVHNARIQSFKDLNQLLVFMAGKMSWLDFLNMGISSYNHSFYPPAILLTSKKSLISDLGFYRNLRCQIHHNGSDESILFCSDRSIQGNNPIRFLAEIIGKSKIGSDYCCIQARSENKKPALRLANRLRPQFSSFKKETFHVDLSFDHYPPIAYCYEKEDNCSVYLDGDIVTIRRPTFENATISAFGKFCCDLVKDSKTNRYPFDYALPHDRDILDLINLTPGEFYNFSRHVKFGYEMLSIEFTGSSNDFQKRFRLPSAEEVFQVILSRDGFKILKDEKNIRYSRALDLFKSLATASVALRGSCWSIINAISNEPLTCDKIWGKAKLGKRSKKILLPQHADWILKDLQWPLFEIAKKRIQSAIRGNLTKESTPDDGLEFLVNTNIINRKWLLDRCPGCDKDYWTDHIDIATHVKCPGCTTIIPLNNSVKVGYELNPLLNLALKEGFRPVALTAAFLKSLSRHGFIWHPGVKLSKDKVNTDIDILAVIDGLLIAGECKDLADNRGVRDPVWKKVEDQLKIPISYARECGFKMFFLSSFSQTYPKALQGRLHKIAGDSMKLLFINKSDLERGYGCEVDKSGNTQRVTIDMFFSINAKRMKKTTKRRRIYF